MERRKDLLALCRAGEKVEEIYYCPGSDLGTVEDEKIGEFEELGIDVIKISKLAFSKKLPTVLPDKGSLGW